MTHFSFTQMNVIEKQIMRGHCFQQAKQQKVHKNNKKGFYRTETEVSSSFENKKIIIFLKCIKNEIVFIVCAAVRISEGS